MPLEEYWKKRKFEKTPEPRGKIEFTGKKRFVVHDHFAQKAGHHHDFRLEMDGVLKSWAVRKGVPEKKGIKVLAIEVEPHPISYFNFTGIIPPGEYGAGEVKIFDKGDYELIEKKEDRITFELKGEKLRGKYCLLKFKGRKNQWLLFKIE